MDDLLKQARELETQAKALRRRHKSDQEFLAEADSRRVELETRWREQDEAVQREPRLYTVYGSSDWDKGPILDSNLQPEVSYSGPQV